jgi:hypothetical protein
MKSGFYSIDNTTSVLYNTQIPDSSTILQKAESGIESLYEKVPFYKSSYFWPVTIGIAILAFAIKPPLKILAIAGVGYIVYSMYGNTKQPSQPSQPTKATQVKTK